MDYVNRLNSYDGPDFAKLALSDPYRLYEEACLIYKTAAAKAMPWTPSSPTLSHTSAPRSSLRDGTIPPFGAGRLTQLENNWISDAIDSYLSSENPTDFSGVIQAAEREDHSVDLTRYLASCQCAWETSARPSRLLTRQTTRRSGKR
jgi:hypothetical protein